MRYAIGDFIDVKIHGQVEKAEVTSVGHAHWSPVDRKNWRNYTVSLPGGGVSYIQATDIEARAAA